MKQPRINRMGSDLSPQEMRQVWQVLKEEAGEGLGDWRAVCARCVVGLVVLGADLAEVLKLRWQDLDLAWTMRIRLSGPNELTRSFLLTGPLQWCFFSLIGYMAFHTKPGHTHDRMFLTPKGDPVSVASLEKYLSHVAKKAGIKKPVTFKGFSTSPWRKGFALQFLGGRENVSKATRFLKGRRRD